MDAEMIRKSIPTFAGYWERYQESRQNRLPKHLRPPSILPVWFQLSLNSGIIIALWTMISNQDEYLSEYGPAIGMIVCLMLVIYTVISAMQLRIKFRGIPGQRLVKTNIWFTGIAFLMWAATVAVFLR